MSRSPVVGGQGAADGDDRERVADWSAMRDASCPHCGAPMKNGGCATCAHELARLSASSRLLVGSEGAPEVAAPEPAAVEPVQATPPEVAPRPRPQR